jgi:hypothetical protein
MNKTSALFLASALCALSALARADGTAREGATLRELKPPVGMKLSANTAMPSNFRDTECLDISDENTREKVGFICESSDPEFIREMGIARFDTLPARSRPAQRPESGLLVATPMKQYDMRRFIEGSRIAYGAVVDCDASEGAVYRASASCHVAVMQREDGKTVYSNFVLQNHVNKKPPISTTRIRDLWRPLVLR